VTLKQHYLSLVSILYAYVYDVRINMGESSVESAWTMCKLSPTLSWLEHPQSMPELVETLLRRTMCYPLYRHWALTVTCLRDVAQLLVSGRAAVVKALLHVLAMLRKHEDGWRIGRIWLEDYAAWVQQPETAKGAVRASLLFSLAQDLLKICTQLDQHPVRFEIAGWNLAQLEQYAHELHQDDEDAAGDSSSSSCDSCESESSDESDAE
jgi:protein SHQ1